MAFTARHRRHHHPSMRSRMAPKTPDRTGNARMARSQKNRNHFNACEHQRVVDLQKYITQMTPFSGIASVIGAITTGYIAGYVGSGTQRTGLKVSCKTTGCRFSISLVQGLAKSQALLNLSSRHLIVFFAFEQSSVEHPETFSLEG
jgi:hypothetical protein